MKLELILALSALSFGAAEAASLDNSVVAHEWGTFTSVAGADGSPIEWAPLIGPPDLPCFVKSTSSGINKRTVDGFVRMETPVLYFYSQRPQALSVHVDFPQGLITEWYPSATKGTTGIDWNDMQLLPGQNVEVPAGKGASRYYAARNTDAAPLRVGDEREKMIFYRGVGTFLTPVRPKYLDDGSLEISNASRETIPLAILFENHDGKIGYRTITNLKDPVMLGPPLMYHGLETLQQLFDLLAESLVKSGLYPREARAMLETWRDSWFEEGTRVIYLVPRTQTDFLLPLTITPAPANVERVFVGRVEVLSPSEQAEFQHAVDLGDSATLAKLGRFLTPLSRRLTRTTNAAQTALSSLQQSSGSATCIQ